jgi:hypothetical protein
MLNLSILFIEFSKVTAIMFFLTEYDFTFSFVKIMNRQITLSFSLLDEIKTEVFTNVTLSYLFFYRYKYLLDHKDALGNYI